MAFTAYVWLLHHESPSKVGTYAYVNPVVAVASVVVIVTKKQSAVSQAWNEPGCKRNVFEYQKEPLKNRRDRPHRKINTRVGGFFVQN